MAVAGSMKRRPLTAATLTPTPTASKASSTGVKTFIV
jgi:hypothetical protein